MYDYQTKFRAIVLDCAKYAEQTMRDMSMRGTPVELYIWHTPAIDGAWGLLRVAADQPGPDFVLTCSEPLRGNVPYSNIHQWIASRVTRAPICGK